MSNFRKTLSSVGPGIFFMLCTFVLFFLFTKLPAQFSDYHYFYRPASLKAIAGENLYDIKGFVSPPWLIPLLLPFVYFPEKISLALIAVFSMLLIFFTLNFFKQKGIGVVLCCLTPAMASLVALGQIDVLVLIGMAAGYRALDKGKGWLLGVSLLLLMIKPQLSLLVGILFFLKAGWKMRGESLMVVLFVWSISGILTGMWWPFGIDFSSIIHSDMMDCSTRALIDMLPVPSYIFYVIQIAVLIFWLYLIRSRPVDYTIMSFSVLLCAIMMPYLARHSTAIVYALGFPLIFRKYKIPGVLLYQATFIPILSLWIEPWYAGWESLVLWGMVLPEFLILRDKSIEV